MNLDITQNYLEKNKMKIEFMNGKYYINLPEDLIRAYRLKDCEYEAEIDFGHIIYTPKNDGSAEYVLKSKKEENISQIDNNNTKDLEEDEKSELVYNIFLDAQKKIGTVRISSTEFAVYYAIIKTYYENSKCYKKI